MLIEFAIREVAMPRISEFQGISIYMYFDDARRHNAPHLHVIYAEYEASFSIATGEMLAGRLPRRQSRRVRSWIETRRVELMENWQLTQDYQQPNRVAPL